MKRAELPLRRDVLWLLQAALALDSAALAPSKAWGTEEEILQALPCLEDWDGPLSSPVSSLTLLDHNSVSPGSPVSLLLPLAPARQPQAILDHHQDMGDFQAVQGSARRIAYDAAAGRGIASTCTLVAEDALAHPSLTPGLAYALLGVILLDSLGLNAAAGKVTERDSRAALALQQYLLTHTRALSSQQPAPGVEDLQVLYSTLQGLKSDPAWWATLPLPTALAYDRKTFPGYSASSVLVSLSTLLSGPSLRALRDTLAQGEEPPLHFVLLTSMVMGEDGLPRRQLAIVRLAGAGESERVAQRVLAALTQPGCALQLQAEAHGCMDPQLRVDLFQQGNVKASRKQVVPIIQQAMVG